jgi:hypothetical protein
LIERIGVFLGLFALIGLAAGSNGFQVDSMTFSLASDYINISGNADLTKYKGSGTAEDPYIIEGLNLKDHVGNGIVIRDTDAYILIKNCTMENLSGGYMGLSALGMIIDNAKIYRSMIAGYPVVIFSSPKARTSRSITVIPAPSYLMV